MCEKKTAFVLSGGGSRGAYECGAWKAITELGIDIDMVVGVSVGAINGAMVVQGDLVKTENLWRQMETDMIFDVDAEAKMQDFAKEFLTHRGAGTSGLHNMLKQYADEEAIRSSDMEFGLLTVEFPSLKPHYLWVKDIPQGQLHDYIIASASAFPAVHTHKIGDKDFIDGGFENNLPVPMAWEGGATEVIAVYLDAVGKFYPEQVTDVENLTLIRSKWNLGDFLAFDKVNTSRILRLGYLDTMKVYEVFDGEYFTFVKNSFEKRNLRFADAAAQIFGLDPLVIYRREPFIELIKEASKKARAEMEKDIDFSDLKNLKGISALTIAGKIKELLKVANKKTVTMFIADNIKEKGDKSIFYNKYAMKMLDTEIRAARFLEKFDLI